MTALDARAYTPDAGKRLAEREENMGQYGWKEPSEVQVGDVATHFVGSDSYGVRVSKIQRFASGKRKGEIKYVWTQRMNARNRDVIICAVDEKGFTELNGGAKFYAKLEKVCRHIKRCECNRGHEVILVGGGWWDKLRVGQAVDYSDPSF